MKPSDFVTTAGELAANSEQRHMRAAIHAAYYGVYHLLAEYFQLDPQKFEATHKELRERLGGLADASKVPPYIWSAKMHFKDLWEARRHADYVLGSELDEDDAYDLVEACKGIVAKR